MIKVGVIFQVLGFFFYDTNIVSLPDFKFAQGSLGANLELCTMFVIQPSIHLLINYTLKELNIWGYKGQGGVSAGS